jgi:hypothetical protein
MRAIPSTIRAYNPLVDINEVVGAIEEMLRGYAGVVACQVRPSGDDVDVIKIWVDLGNAAVDRHAWAKNCEAAIRTAIPASQPFRLTIYAERDAV